MCSEEVKKLKEEKESHEAQMARLKEELRLAQKESEEKARELERLQEEKKQVGVKNRLK